ncbi:hypothetical protein [Pseudomonas frederiksbergensis]|uniref:hypothetical protein n=1 Tax=Pseudomonas frederiksbergensis TaxID=104087 RepID=UPI001374773F|nr:hypothetical protein [Pseudomonas frederiksbergensis]
MNGISLMQAEDWGETRGAIKPQLAVFIVPGKRSTVRYALVLTGSFSIHGLASGS